MLDDATGRNRFSWSCLFVYVSLHRQFAIQPNSKITNDGHRLNCHIGNVQVDVSTIQLLEAGFRAKPNGLCLHWIKLQSSGNAPLTHSLMHCCDRSTAGAMSVG